MLDERAPEALPDAATRPAPLGWSWLWILVPVALISIRSSFPVFAGDIWMHLASAREIVTTGEISKVDTFLYTTKPNTRYINHSWGAQLAYYAAYRALGVEGLSLLRILLAVGLAAGFWLYAVQRGADRVLAALVTAGGVSVAASYFITRPLMFAPVCAGGILLCLQRATWPRVLGALAIQLLWANLHASFPLGIVIMGCLAVEATLMSLVPRTKTWVERPLPRASRLWACAAAAALICLLNPNGADLYRYIYDLQRLAWVHHTIQEWMPPEWHRFVNRWFAAGLAFAWLSVVVAGLVNRRLLAADLLLLSAFTYKVTEARRFILLCMIFAIAPTACALTALAVNRTRLRLLLQILTGALVMTVFTLGLTTQVNHRGVRIDLDEAYLPVAAVRYMRKNGLTGNIACAPYAGGFLEWAFPEGRPATDGRCLVNDPPTILAFNALARGRSGWEKAFPRQGVSDVMLIESTYSYTPIHKRLLVFRTSDQTPQVSLGEWGIVYWNEYWQVMVRRSSPHGHLLQEEVALSAPGVLPHAYAGLSPSQKKAIGFYLEARLQEMLKDDALGKGIVYALLGYMQYGAAMDQLSAMHEAKNRIRALRREEKVKDIPALEEKAKRAEQQVGQLLQASNDLYDNDILLSPGQSRSIGGRARNLLWLDKTDEVKPYLEAAGRIDPLTWIRFRHTILHRLDYLVNVRGPDAPATRRMRQLKTWFEAAARGERDEIIKVLHTMEQEDTLPEWLKR